MIPARLAPRSPCGFSVAALAVGAWLALAAMPFASARAETAVASIIGPPVAAKGAWVPFIVSVDPPPAHRLDVLMHLSQVGAGVPEADLGRRSLAVGPSGYAHFLVATENSGIGADGQIRAALIGDGHSYRASRTAGAATVQVRDGSGRTDLPVVSLAAPRSVAEGATAAVILSASPLPREPLAVEVAVRTQLGEESRTLTLGRDGFAQLPLATEDDEVAQPDRITVVEALPSGIGAYRVSRNAAAVQVVVLDDDWPDAPDPHPNLSIVAPPVARTGVESAFIVSVNPPPPPGGSIEVPLRFGQTGIRVIEEEDEEAPAPLRFHQTGGAGTIEPRLLDSESPMVEIWEDGLATVSFAGTLEEGVEAGLVSAAIVGSADGAYRVSERHGLAAVRIAGGDGDGTTPILPRVSIRAPDSAFEGQRARFLLFADPVPERGGSATVTVRVAPGGGASLTLPSDCSGRNCPVTVSDSGWGLLEVLVPEDAERGAGASVTATVLEPVGADYRPAAAASLRSATVRIVDDDGAPLPQPAVALTAPVEVGEGGQALFLLSANPPPAADLPVRIAITRGGGHVASEQTGLRSGAIPAAGYLELSVPTIADDGERGADGWVRARLLRDDADPYRIAGPDARQVRIRDNGETPATPPRLRIAAPPAITEGAHAPFLLSAVPPPPSPLAVSVVIRESGGQYLSAYDDPEQRTVALEATIGTEGVEVVDPETGETGNAGENLGGSTLTATIQASGSSPPDYQIALGQVNVRVQDDDPATTPPPPQPPRFSVRPVAGSAPAGTHAHFLLTADRKYESAEAPAVRMLIRAEGEAGIDLDRQRLLPLTANGGCDAANTGGDGAAYRYAALRDSGLSIPEGAVYLCVPTAVGDRAVTLALGETFDSDDYRRGSPASARVTVTDQGGPAAVVPVVSVVGPPAVGVGAHAGFIVSYAADPPAAALPVRLNLSGAVTRVERLQLPPPPQGFAEFAVIVPVDSDAGHVTATLAEPPDPAADGHYAADPERGSARVAVVDAENPETPLPTLSIAAPPTVARGGASAFLLSATPVPAQPIAATVASSSSWRRIVPIDQTGVALLAVRADGESPFESDGILAGCLEDDPDGLYQLAGSGEACARIQVLESEPGFATVSLAAPPTVGGGGPATLLLSADPPPGPAGLHVRLEVASRAGEVLRPGEAGPRTEFIGPDGIALVSVRTQNAAGRFSASIPATEATDGYRRDQAGHSVEVAVRAVGDQAVRLPAVAVAVASGPRTVEGGTVEFVVASTPPTPGLRVGYRLSGDRLPSSEEATGLVTLDARGRAVVQVDTMDDGLFEPDGALTITLLPGDGHRLEAGGGTATARIVDDDAPVDAPLLSLASAAHALEGAPARFALTADPPPAAPAIVTVEIGGAVAPGRAGPMRLTLPASGYVRFSVPTLDNAVADRAGEVTAALMEPARGMRIEPNRARASVAVVDDDGPRPHDSPVPVVSLLAPGSAWEAERIDLDVVADGRPPSGRLRVRICLEGAGSLHPTTAVNSGWARLDGTGQAVLPLWPGVPDGGVAASADCPAPETEMTAGALVGAVAGESRLAVRIMARDAAGYSPSDSGSDALITVRRR